MVQPGLRTPPVLIMQNLTDSGKEFGLQLNDIGMTLDCLDWGAGWVTGSDVCP